MAFANEVTNRFKAISSAFSTRQNVWHLQYIDSIVWYSALLRCLSRRLQKGNAGEESLCAGILQLVFELGSAVCGIRW